MEPPNPPWLPHIPGWKVGRVTFKYKRWKKQEDENVPLGVGVGGSQKYARKYFGNELFDTYMKAFKIVRPRLQF